MSKNFLPSVAVWRCWGWIFLLLGVVARGEELPPLEFREVIVRVVNENGLPMAGVKVQLLGTGRDALQAVDAGSAENAPGVWRFVSDARGRCRARFACCSGYDSRERAGKWMPGWGRFYFIATSDRLRGVSDCIIHEDSANRMGGEGEDEWMRRGIDKTATNPIAVTLRMQRGISVSGRVFDASGKPVRGFDVALEEDLYSESHSGYGNEIFGERTSSNAKGEFSFERVFPNTFHLRASMNEERLPVWVRTRLHGRWAREAVDVIAPRRGEHVVRLTMGVVSKLPYRYYGKIMDEAGQTVAGAAMVFGVSLHRIPSTFEDDHHFLYTKSDAQGRYEVLSVTPFVRFVSVKAPGYADFEEFHDDQDGMKELGPRNLTLIRQ